MIHHSKKFQIWRTTLEKTVSKASLKKYLPELIDDGYIEVEEVPTGNGGSVKKIYHVRSLAHWAIYDDNAKLNGSLVNGSSMNGSSVNDITKPTDNQTNKNKTKLTQRARGDDASQNDDTTKGGGAELIDSDLIKKQTWLTSNDTAKNWIEYRRKAKIAEEAQRRIELKKEEALARKLAEAEANRPPEAQNLASVLKKRPDQANVLFRDKDALEGYLQGLTNEQIFGRWKHLVFIHNGAHSFPEHLGWAKGPTTEFIQTLRDNSLLAFTETCFQLTRLFGKEPRITKLCEIDGSKLAEKCSGVLRILAKEKKWVPNKELKDIFVAKDFNNENWNIDDWVVNMTNYAEKYANKKAFVNSWQVL
jgi:hypothetical protein